MTKIERDRKIIAKYDLGHSLRECGEYFGLSHEAVRSLLVKHGQKIRKPHKGMGLSPAERKELEP